MMPTLIQRLPVAEARRRAVELRERWDSRSGSITSPASRGVGGVDPRDAGGAAADVWSAVALAQGAGLGHARRELPQLLRANGNDAFLEELFNVLPAAPAGASHPS